MSADQLNSALNLLRRMPPSRVQNSLAGLISLVPELANELLTDVDRPLQVMSDPKSGKKFVLGEYNRDGDSHRSPWSNEYFPAMDDGYLPSKKLRDLEVVANSLFEVYRKMYFGSEAFSSVYFFDTDEKDDEAFGACYLIHKDVEPANSLQEGWWDSTHVFEVSPDKDGFFVYKLMTTVMISMGLGDSKIGKVDLSGLRNQQDTKRLKVTADSPHIVNMGKMLEDMELRIRSAIEGIYIQKTRQVINGMRSATSQRDNQWTAIAQSLNAAVFHHANKDGKKE